MPEERFIAEGRELLMSTKEYRAAQTETIAAVRARYAGPLASAGIFGRLVLRFRMQREMAREIEKLAPRDALYLQSQ
jgi:hypothetical protein